MGSPDKTGTQQTQQSTCGTGRMDTDDADVTTKDSKNSWQYVDAYRSLGFTKLPYLMLTATRNMLVPPFQG